MDVRKLPVVAVPHGSDALLKSSRPDAPTSKNAAVGAVEDIVYGSAAGIVGKFIEYPFDTVKVRLQSQPDRKPLRYKGPLDCFRQSLHQDGFVGMYRGISAPLLGAALETSSLFVWEQIAQKGIYATGLYDTEKRLPLSALFLTGAISGAFTSLVLTPVELIKCKMQVPFVGTEDGMPKTGRTPLAIVRSVFQHQGILGFWNGQVGTLIRETGGSAAWFGSKETMTMFFRKINDKTAGMTDSFGTGAELDSLPLWQQAVAGASAGVTYNFLFFPADTIKSRMQTSPVEVTETAQTFWEEGAALWRQHGIAGMYRGCGITVLRSAPSSAFIFIIYDALKRRFPMS